PADVGEAAADGVERTGETALRERQREERDGGIVALEGSRKRRMKTVPRYAGSPEAKAPRVLQEDAVDSEPRDRRADVRRVSENRALRLGRHGAERERHARLEDTRF